MVKQHVASHPAFGVAGCGRGACPMNGSLKVAKIAKIAKFAKSSGRAIDAAPHRMTHWKLGLAFTGAA